MGYTIDYKQHLNEEQYRAVMHHKGPCLVIAGAGTGKTTTLVYRVARLIEDGVKPESILFLTFTRKAADNMALRCSKMLDERCQLVNASTFHGFCLSELKRYATYTGYTKDFTVMDQEDADEILNLIKEELNIIPLPFKFPKNQVILSIQSKSITKLLSLDEVTAEYYPSFKNFASLIGLILKKYQTFKKDRNIMNFDDLLTNFRKLIIESDFVRQTIGNKYRFIMIDEYQDTDKIQADISKMVADYHGNIMAVGDDAQSIYAFRGADFQNIMSFPKLFKDTEIIKLERNYRSTKGILSLGNAIMKNAKERYPKNLYTDKPGEDKPLLIRSWCSHEQSLFVADAIDHHQRQGSKLKDIAVLFRNGHFSYDLEIKLSQRRLPFKKFGGLEFGNKSHIKDVMAFLKVGINIGDILSWHRILKLYPGIGPKKSAKITNLILNDTNGIEHLRQENLSELYHFVMSLSIGYEILDKKIKRIAEFYRPLFDAEYQYKQKRWKDIEMLMTIASNYISMPDFINSVSMNSMNDEDDGERNVDDYITLSTIHSAKGLEWDIVFIIFVNDGCMPCVKNNSSQADIDEEVRIFHVAVTRAKNHLYLIAPIVPPYKESTGQISSFLTGEIESEILEVRNVSPVKMVMRNC